MLVKLFIVLFLAVILFSLGQGLYFMLRDRGQTDRTLKALTRRIGLSVLLFVLLLIGMATGVVPYHKGPLSGGTPVPESERGPGEAGP